MLAVAGRRRHRRPLALASTMAPDEQFSCSAPNGMRLRLSCGGPSTCHPSPRPPPPWDTGGQAGDHPHRSELHQRRLSRARNTRLRFGRCSAHRVRPEPPHRPRSRPVFGPPTTTRVRPVGYGDLGEQLPSIGTVIFKLEMRSFKGKYRSLTHKFSFHNNSKLLDTILVEDLSMRL